MPRKQESLSPSKAYIDTTILTDALLKKNPQGDKARSALKAFDATILPVYAIKEFKSGPLDYFIYLHNKLLSTKSLSQTLRALGTLLSYQKNRPRTAIDAIADLMASGPPRKMTDEEQADLFRGALARLILAAWSKRRKVTTAVSDELSCYSETDPKIEIRTGRFSNPGKICKLYGPNECCLASSLKSRLGDMPKLIDAMKGQTGREHTRRREVLHKLANTPKKPMSAFDCARLGDAYFALYAPSDSKILTTNLRDHIPLATALGKTAIGPDSARPRSESGESARQP
jgi:hypothetical protein